MSHLKERTEKNCLNCGAQVAGRYCQQCGQENVEVKESFFHLLMHFVEDLTHFDGKLWKTLKLLLFKPGSLTKLYMDGKRTIYLHPIRMYLFVSAVFFFFIFSGSELGPNKIAATKLDVKTKDSISSVASKNAVTLNFGSDTINYKTLAAYDSAQLKLPTEKKDGWFASKLVKQGIHLEQKYKGDKAEIFKALIEQFQHFFSRMLYISLPMFAFFLWLLYRRTKTHYFVDHLIFSIHIYSAFFIILFAVKLIDEAYKLIFNKPFILLDVTIVFVLFFYLYKSLKNHFNQSTSKTIFKFFILNILTLVLMSFLMFTFVMLSIFNI